MKNSILVVLLFVYIKVAAQTVNYPESKVYYQKRIENVDISIVKGQLSIKHKILDRKVFNEAVGPAYSTEYLSDRSFSEITNIKAKIGYPKNSGKYMEEKVKDIVQLTDFDGGIFNSNDTYHQILFPNVERGSFTEIQYDLAVNEPHFFKGFYFSEYYPVQNASYTILMDTAVEIGWKLYGLEKDRVNFEKTMVAGRYLYSWTLNDLEAVIFEKGDLGFLHNATHLVVYIKKYRSDGQTTTILSSVEDLFNWYHSLIAKITPSDNAEITRITNDLIAGAKNDREKAERIFYWVQDNVRYIAFEDGWRGFIPYPAAEICEKRYGDCKDMTHLMFEMMKIAGLKAEHAWIGTRRLPYRYEDVPCPSVDNHLVVSLLLNDSIYILDATDSHTPFGVPTSFILSKEAFFKSADGNYEIYNIPQYDADFCTVQNDILISSDGYMAFGEASKTVESFEYSTFHNLYGLAGSEKKEFLLGYLRLGPNNFKIKKSTITEVEPRAKTKIEFEYEIPGYIREIGGSCFINLNLIRPMSDELLTKDRAHDFEIRHKAKHEMKVAFILPDGKQVIGLPAPASQKFDVGSYDAKYIVEGNKIIFTRTITVDRLVITSSEFKQWNDFIRGLQNIYTTTIEFK